MRLLIQTTCRSRWSVLVWFCLFSMVMFGPINSVQAQVTHTVLNTDDDGAGSLRQAIAEASPGDVIEFDASVVGGIALTSGELVIDKDLTITGPGAGESGGGPARVSVAPGGF